jgi:Spy/CpxP family protein refolding chaperone
VKRLALVLGLLLGASALAQAQGQGQGMAEGKWWKRPRIAQELQLTPDQEGQLEKIFIKSKPKLIDLRADLEKKQFDYEQAMQGDSADRKAVEAKIEAREEARASLQKELASMELDMKQVLKPEQRERLMRLRAENRQRLQERRRRFRDGEGERMPDSERPAHPGKQRREGQGQGSGAQSPEPKR